MGYVEYDDEGRKTGRDICTGARSEGCGKEANTQYSLGLYAGLYCEECWKDAPYRKDGAEGFDPTYAGERYDDEY